MPIKIDDLLRIACTHGASDLHLKVGAFPVLRVDGVLKPMTDTRRLLQEQRRAGVDRDAIDDMRIIRARPGSRPYHCGGYAANGGRRR